MNGLIIIPTEHKRLLMISDSVILVTAFILLPLVLLLFALFVCIPKMLATLQKLKHSQKPADFSLTIFWGAVAATFLLFIYLVSVRITWIHRDFIQGEIVRLILGMVAAYLIFSLFVPKAYTCFHRWKATHHSLYFSLMTLLGLVALYLWSLLSLGFIFLALGG